MAIFAGFKVEEPVIMNKKEKLELLQTKMIKEIMDYSIILLDTDGTILSWNAGAQKIKGYTEEEIVGQNFSIFYLPSDRQAQLPQKLIEQAKKEGSARHIGRRVRKDGSIFWGSILITALHDDNRQIIGFTKLTKELVGNQIDG
ncbi:MAG TPA: PAS domain-containing protein [Bacteroidia bacterium]